MSIASTLSGKLSIKHPQLDVLCREDGAILIRCRGSNKTDEYHYTFGSNNGQDYKKIKINGKNYFVHRLIAEAFIPSIQGKTFIDHINRVRNDNRAENLRWVTPKENSNNTIKVLNRDKRIIARWCEDKKAYYKAYASVTSTFKLHIKKSDGSSTMTGMLPQDIYDQLKPLSQRERFIAYHAWKQSLKE